MDGRRVGVRGARFANYRVDFCGKRVREMWVEDVQEILTVLWRRSALIETFVYEQLGG